MKLCDLRGILRYLPVDSLWRITQAYTFVGAAFNEMNTSYSFFIKDDVQSAYQNEK
jgi:hypothetical protein